MATVALPGGDEALEEFPWPGGVENRPREW
jgi:hypothetical protein